MPLSWLGIPCELVYFYGKGFLRCSVDRDDIRIFAEIGVGNRYFISTEIEKGDLEHRIYGFMPMQLLGVYIRVWIGKTVYAVSTNKGFNKQKKTKSRFKFLLGFEGIPKKCRR